MWCKIYTERILKEFDKAGYNANYHLLDASKMGIPQRRERVFFIAIRKDLAHKVKPLKFDFQHKKIPFSKIKTAGEDFNFTNHDHYVWNNRVKGDRKYACVLKRLENRNSNFNSVFIYEEQVPCTLLASVGSKMVLFSEPRKMNLTELKLCQSFPLDYNFGTDNPNKIKYILGMSVPPVMMANLADEIYNQWKIIFEKRAK